MHLLTHIAPSLCCRRVYFGLYVQNDQLPFVVESISPNYS
jgi:hypothetical protein